MPRLDAERIALWRELCTTSARLQRAVDRTLTDVHGLPLAWFDVLTEIRNGGGSIRVHELCVALDEVPSSLSRRLDRMEHEGLVRRKATPRPDVRRAVTVSSTPDGRAVWRDANISYRRMVQQHFAQRLTETDIAALQRVWGKLASTSE
ncbi:MAG TPA: MarR family transcriptional regulator [Ilumatobacteraceae bacterium]|nr:MarR family transcriptional regulator [Ilumatobacteraceae bacterium]